MFFAQFTSLSYTTVLLDLFYILCLMFIDTAKHAKAARIHEINKIEETLHRSSPATESAEKVPRMEATDPSRSKRSLMSVRQHSGGKWIRKYYKGYCPNVYLKKLKILWCDSPFQYRGTNHHACFPILAAIAVKFLSVPSTTVKSEDYRWKKEMTDSRESRNADIPQKQFRNVS